MKKGVLSSLGKSSNITNTPLVENKKVNNDIDFDPFGSENKIQKSDPVFEPFGDEKPKSVEKPMFEPFGEEKPKSVEKPVFEPFGEEKPTSVEKPVFEPFGEEKSNNDNSLEFGLNENESKISIEAPFFTSFPTDISTNNFDSFGEQFIREEFGEEVISEKKIIEKNELDVDFNSFDDFDSFCGISAKEVIEERKHFKLSDSFSNVKAFLKPVPKSEKNVEFDNISERISIPHTIPFSQTSLAKELKEYCLNNYQHEFVFQEI